MMHDYSTTALRHDEVLPITIPHISHAQIFRHLAPYFDTLRLCFYLNFSNPQQKLVNHSPPFFSKSYVVKKKKERGVLITERGNGKDIREPFF